MGRRWKQEEQAALAEIRKNVKELLEDGRPLFPEVVGDRRILRFLRGRQWDIAAASTMYAEFLRWRTKNKVDQIRQEIVFGGRNSPFFFPKGKTIIDLAPQIIITPFSLDVFGRPLAVEQYCFNPRDVLKVITREDYLLFLTYALEYRALVMEQLSHDKEMEYVAKFPNEADRKEGYGVVLLDYTIRDLKGVGFYHIGSDGRAILSAALNLGLPNYPEYLGKSHMINVPSIFSALWYFLKQILDEPTQAKFEFSGSEFMAALTKDISLDNVPVCFGGKLELYNEPFFFDTSPSSPLYYSEMEQDKSRMLGSSPKFVFDYASYGLEAPVSTIPHEVQRHKLFRHPAAPSIVTTAAESTEKKSTVEGQPSTTANDTATAAVDGSRPGTARRGLEIPEPAAASGASESPPLTTKQEVAARAWFYISRFLRYWWRVGQFCWNEYPALSFVGLVSAMYLVLHEPLALQGVLTALLAFLLFADYD